MPISSLEQVGISAPYNTLSSSVQTMTTLIPVDPQSFNATETVQEIRDSGRRGLDAMDFEVYRGVNITDISFNSSVQDHGTNVMPVMIFLKEILISDYRRGGTTSPYRHYLRMGNATTREYLDFEHWVGSLYSGRTGSTLSTTPARAFTGCRPTEVTVSFNSGEGAVTYSVTLQGQGATQQAKTTLTDNSLRLYSGWQGGMFLGTAAAPAVTLSGYNYGRLISGEWTFRRSGKPVYTLANTRDFANYTLGPLEVMFNGVFEYERDYEYNIFQSDSGFITKFGTLFTNGTTGTGARHFGIAANRMAWFAEPARVDTSEEFVKLQLSGRALYDNAANSGMFSSKDADSTNITAAKKTQAGPVEIYNLSSYAGGTNKYI